MRQMELHPAYEVTTPPSAAVLTTAEAKGQLRVDGNDEDTLVDGYIEAATQLVETDARLYLRPAGLTLHVDRFPFAFCGPLLIERAPVTGVTSITYVDPDGESAVWDPDEYTVDLVSRPARVHPAWGLSWPTFRRQPGGITVAFAAGYAAGEAPQTALQAIRLLVGHWFENREAAGRVTQEIAIAYTSLLERLLW